MLLGPDGPHHQAEGWSFTISTPAASTATDLSLSVHFLISNGVGACTWTSGQTVPMTSNCLQIGASGGPNFDFTAVAGTNTSMAMPPLTGSLTLNQAPAASGQPLSITFSGNATMLNSDPTTSAATPLVPVSGTASATTTTY